MRDLFIQVVNMSLTASWLIVAVMVSRMFLTRTSKSLVCFLWILVGVRLILPISFESRMSVVPTLEPIVIHQVNEVVNTGEITVQGITNSYEVVTSLDWLSVVSFVWMIGIAVLLVYATYRYWQLHRKFAASIEIGKDIYIFDEATSNIDVESEDKIMKVVQELAKTKLVILISHRLANVVKADQIFVMEKGQIVETGNHTTLLANKGTYRKLFYSQQE